MPIKPIKMKHLETIQGNIVKRALGLPHPTHSTELMNVLWLLTIEQLIMKNSLNLWHCVVKSTTPERDLNNVLPTQYAESGTQGHPDRQNVKRFLDIFLKHFLNISPLRHDVLLLLVRLF